MSTKDKYLSAINRIFSDTYALSRLDLSKDQLQHVSANINIFGDLVLTINNNTITIKNHKLLPDTVSALVSSDEYLSNLNVTKQGIYEYVKESSK